MLVVNFFSFGVGFHAHMRGIVLVVVSITVFIYTALKVSSQQLCLLLTIQILGRLHVFSISLIIFLD